MIGILVWLVLGCGKTAPECSETVSCGFGEMCVEGVCKGQTCATSAQCNMEQYCSGGACVAGCEDDEDCYPGDACDVAAATCGPATCTDTRTDCAFGEFCNTLTGECYDAGGYYCHPCVGDEDCGGNGNYCLDFGYPPSNFCGVTCTFESDCPDGYTCAEVSLPDSAVTFQCITYCWLFSGGRAVPPSPLPPPSVRPVGGR